MTATDMLYEAKDTTWVLRVYENLDDKLFNLRNELIWAIDCDKKITLANEAYKRFVYKTTGKQVHIDEPALSEIIGQDMTYKWDSFYTRALRGEKFNIITNYLSVTKPMIINASFIPIIESDNILGMVCVARDDSR